jgi:valyl-tRNA synthetase
MAFVLRLQLGEITPSAQCEIGNVKVEFDLTGSIDVVAERARLEKDLASAQKDKATAEVKLNNQGFMAKAPEDVVIEIRERLVKTSADIERLTMQLSKLPTA